MAYRLEQKALARELIVVRQATYEEAAAETGVSLSTLKQWGKEGGWAEAQKEFEKEYLESSGNMQKLFIEMSKKALKSQHSQDVIAVTNLMRAMPTGRKSQSVDKPAYFLEVMAKLVAYIKESDGEALRHLEPLIQGFAESMKEAA